MLRWLTIVPFLLLASAAGAAPHWPPVSVHCRNENLGDVVRAVARQLNLNVKIGPGIEERVSAELYGVPADLALEELLGPSFTCYRYRNTLIVGDLAFGDGPFLEEPLLVDSLGPEHTTLSLDLTLGKRAYVVSLVSDGQKACWRGSYLDQEYAWCGNSYFLPEQGWLSQDLFNELAHFGSRMAWFAQQDPVPCYRPGVFTLRAGPGRFYRSRSRAFPELAQLISQLPTYVQDDWGEALSSPLPARHIRHTPKPLVTVARATVRVAQQPLEPLLKSLAARLALTPYLAPETRALNCGPAEVSDEPREQLRQLLRGTGLSWKQMGGVLAVGPVGRLSQMEPETLAESLARPRGTLRREVSLSHQPAQKVADFLSQQFRGLNVFVFSDRNGFCLDGPVETVRDALREIPALDHVPQPEPEPEPEPPAHSTSVAGTRLTLRLVNSGQDLVAAKDVQSSSDLLLVMVSSYSLEVRSARDPAAYAVDLGVRLRRAGDDVEVQVPGRASAILHPGDRLQIDDLSQFAQLPRAYRRCQPALIVEAGTK